ncbi:MAG TPA: methionyl-tRNA formyltransferase, partial [Hellea balneolensis]|nr:methionyl-tRNA formyltransferase [Hellea balneolensis]
GEPSYAKKIDKSEARIDWNRPAQELDWHIRGLSPFPGAWCELPGKKGPERVKIHMSKVEPLHGHPGEVLDDQLLIGCADDALRITRLQPAGKGVMSAEDYLRGRPCPKGTQLS